MRAARAAPLCFHFKPILLFYGVIVAMVFIQDWGVVLACDKTTLQQF